MDDNVTKILLDMKGELGQVNERTVRILAQTEKTNGTVADLQMRVTKIEAKQAEYRGAGKIKDKVVDQAAGRKWDVAKMFLSSGIGAIVGTIFGALAAMWKGGGQ